VQPKARPVHRGDRRRRIESGENDGDALHHVGRELAPVALLVEPFQALVPEAFRSSVVNVPCSARPSLGMQAAYDLAQLRRREGDIRVKKLARRVA